LQVIENGNDVIFRRSVFTGRITVSRRRPADHRLDDFSGTAASLQLAQLLCDSQSQSAAAGAEVAGRFQAVKGLADLVQLMASYARTIAQQIVQYGFQNGRGNANPALACDLNIDSLPRISLASARLRAMRMSISSSPNIAPDSMTGTNCIQHTRHATGCNSW